MRPSRRWLLVATAATVLGAVGYLAAARSLYRPGFPLDDAWIHQVYARNLVRHAEWAFEPGQPSAGSTSPLWVATLAVGYLARLTPLFWSYLVGGLVLVATGWLGARWLSARLPSASGLAWTAAAVIPLEWHLTWAALSGMETLGLGALALLTCSLNERRRAPETVIGLLIGAGVWLRPEALLLLVVPIGSVLLDRSRPATALVRLLAGAALPVGGYLAFQKALSGQWWPNTFYAKQAEYASLRSIPLVERFLAQLGVPGAWLGQPGLASGGPLVGVLLVLLPGLAIFVVRAARQRRWPALLPLGWVLLHLSSYAVRLPVTYQHGRYAMPVIPVLIVLALQGMLGWVDWASRQRARWVLSRAWAAAAGLVCLAFWLQGARAYGRDVAIIESEMVDTAEWLGQHTSDEALIAAHDIGAIGYFAQRPLLDLAGLVSPEVIPFIRDQAALAAYLDRNQADYLVTFPDWYPELVQGRPVVYASSAEYSPSAGGENMTVYSWEAR